MNDLDLRDRHLDDLLRPALVVDPPPAVRRSILAAVLATPMAAPATAPPPIAVAARPGWSISVAAYLLLGAVLLAYVGVVSWLQGLLGDVGWLGTLAVQLLAVADLLFGEPVTADPAALVLMLLQWAPWLVLLPVAVLLWDRDRAVPAAG